MVEEKMIDISKLAEQAVEETQRMLFMHFKNFESHLYQRFAELIIQECITVCEEVEANTELDGISDGALCCIVEIKERFGMGIVDEKV